MSEVSTSVIDRRAPDSSDAEMSIDIDAPADVVFDFLVVPEYAFRWMGHEGEIDPRPGGTHRVRYSEGDFALGEYVDVDRPNRVSWTWGWEGSSEIPPGSSLVTFTLVEHDDVTTVTLTHTGLPDVQAAIDHTHGWTFWGTRLAVAAAGGDPDAIEWPEQQQDRQGADS